jgi:hypothetical protein
LAKDTGNLSRDTKKANRSMIAYSRRESRARSKHRRTRKQWTCAKHPVLDGSGHHMIGILYTVTASQIEFEIVSRYDAY